jgi:hypothetical protein
MVLNVWLTQLPKSHLTLFLLVKAYLLNNLYLKIGNKQPLFEDDFSIQDFF